MCCAPSSALGPPETALVWWVGAFPSSVCCTGHDDWLAKKTDLAYVRAPNGGVCDQSESARFSCPGAVRDRLRKRALLAFPSAGWQSSWRASSIR
jgi:hypothetical protein